MANPSTPSWSATAWGGNRVEASSKTVEKIDVRVAGFRVTRGQVINHTPISASRFAEKRRYREGRTRRTNWYIAPKSSATIEPKNGQKAASIATLNNCSRHTAVRMVASE